jgi:hypothetical protein
MKTFLFILLFSYTFVACQPSKNNDTSQKNALENEQHLSKTFSFINPDGSTVQTRFNLPEGYSRTPTESNSFGHFLRELPLKADGQPVLLASGVEKHSKSYLAAIDLPIPKGELHQCADGVIRLRTDYLFSQKRFNEISFKFVSGKNYSYLSYLNGKLPTPENKWTYLINVYNSANTTSLNQQLITKSINTLEIGDVFIYPHRNGGYGHAIIVVDKCINSEGNIKFMLAQSYTPAQELEIMDNPNNLGSPWYDLNFGETLITSGMDFQKDELKSFE